MVLVLVVLVLVLMLVLVLVVGAAALGVSSLHQFEGGEEERGAVRGCWTALGWGTV